MGLYIIPQQTGTNQFFNFITCLLFCYLMSTHAHLYTDFSGLVAYAFVSMNRCAEPVCRAFPRRHIADSWGQAATLSAL